MYDNKKYYQIMDEFLKLYFEPFGSFDIIKEPKIYINGEFAHYDYFMCIRKLLFSILWF